MKKVILGVLCFIVLFSMSGCGSRNYTDNMKKVREDFNPWYLETNLNGGDLLDKALKHEKWEEDGNQVVITGKDTKTGEPVEIIYKVEEDKVDFVSMTKDGKDYSYGEWYRYLTNYIS